VGEVILDDLPEIKCKTKISHPFTQVDLGIRPVVRVSLGCHLIGKAQPHPDPWDPLTTQAGVCKRFAFRPPEIDEKLYHRLLEFTRKYLSEHSEYTPLPVDADVSFDTWVNNINHPEWRKQQFRDCVKTMEDNGETILNWKHWRVKSFMKDETYPKFKHARAINSRSDEFKSKVGPWFAAIEKAVYKDPSFIKHVPVRDRPDYIVKRLYREGAHYYATDYSAYESLFVKELMEVEFMLYEHMTQLVPGHDQFMWLVRNVLPGRNRCYFKHFKVSIDATRMSGEMCTSLGNGFANLMFMLFLCEEVGATDVVGVVEGDDGLFVLCGSPPSANDFARLGLIIKMEEHVEISTASFCGIVFDPVDRNNLFNPFEILTSFGWTTAEYAKSRDKRLLMLLRAKGLSFAYQYPGCPIIQELAHYALRMTRGISIGRLLKGRLNAWYRDQLLEAIRAKDGTTRKTVGMNSRLLVEKLYGIKIGEQLKIEEYLLAQTTLHPLDIDVRVHEDCETYWHNYVYEIPLKWDSRRHPAFSGRERMPVQELSNDIVEQTMNKLFKPE
jgi:hypothetical protein